MTSRAPASVRFVEAAMYLIVGVRRFFDDLLDAFEVRYSDRELRPLGDGVGLFLCRMELRGRESAQIVQTVGTFYEFEGEQFGRARVYDDQSEAREAAEAASAERSNA